MKKNSTYFLGRSIAKQYPFERVPIQRPVKPQKDDSIITKKILVIFGIIAIVKIAVLLLWI